MRSSKKHQDTLVNLMDQMDSLQEDTSLLDNAFRSLAVNVMIFSVCDQSGCVVFDLCVPQSSAL